MDFKNTKKCITGIWFAKFDNANSLREYVEYNYLEDENNPKSKFAEESGINNFDSDFMECEFLSNSLEIANHVTKISFAENFHNELLEKINLMDFSNKNSIISLTGIRERNGSVNDNLFNFILFENANDNLQLVGLFNYEID
jgi:hypothetical protein